MGLSPRYHRAAGVLILWNRNSHHGNSEFLLFSSRPLIQAHSSNTSSKTLVQPRCAVLHYVLVFAALSRRCRAAPQSRAAVLSLNHHILGYTKRPAITRNPARRARSACQVPPTVTSLFTINERFTLHESLPLPIPAPAHIQARVVFCLLCDT